MMAATAIAYAGNEPAALVVDATAPSVEVSTEYSSDSIYRGVDQGQNDAKAVVTTNIELPADIGLQLQAGYTKLDSDVVSEENTDLTAVFSKTVEDYLLSLSYTWYANGYVGEQGQQTQEIGLSVERAVGPVTLSLTQYLGVEGDNNGYSEASALYSDDFDVLPFVLDFKTELGYLTQDAEFTHAGLSVSTDLKVTEGIVATPFVAYNYQLGGEFAKGIDSNDGLYGGVMFKRSF